MNHSFPIFAHLLSLHNSICTVSTSLFNSDGLTSTRFQCTASDPLGYLWADYLVNSLQSDCKCRWKAHQTIADGFKSAFRPVGFLLCSEHRLFTCMQPNSTQVWLATISQSTNRSRKFPGLISAYFHADINLSNFGFVIKKRNFTLCKISPSAEMKVICVALQFCSY